MGTAALSSLRAAIESPRRTTVRQRDFLGGLGLQRRGAATPLPSPPQDLNVSVDTDSDSASDAPADQDTSREQAFYTLEDMSDDEDAPLKVVQAQLRAAEKCDAKIKRMEAKWEQKAQQKKSMAQELLEPVQEEEKREERARRAPTHQQPMRRARQEEKLAPPVPTQTSCEQKRVPRVAVTTRAPQHPWRTNVWRGVFVMQRVRKGGRRHPSV